MSEENKDINNDPGNAGDDDKGGEVTLESLAQALKEQEAANKSLIESMKTATESTVAGLMQQISDRDGDIQNLTNLLGGLANEGNGDEEETEITPDKVKEIISESKKEEAELAKKQSDAHWKVYGEIATDLLSDDGPDGKPLTPEAREGIKKLMVDNGGDMTKNAAKDALRDFKKASKIYYGLDKENPFKGGDIKGIGGGGGDIKGGGKKTYTLTEEAKKELKALGETEEWGREMLEKREKERQEAMV